MSTAAFTAYDFAPATTFLLAANTTYWIEIEATSPNAIEWSWSGDLAATGVAGQSNYSALLGTNANSSMAPVPDGRDGQCSAGAGERGDAGAGLGRGAGGEAPARGKEAVAGAGLCLVPCSGQSAFPSDLDLLDAARERGPKFRPERISQ